LLFAIDFLRLKKYAPKSYKIFNIFKYVILICAVFSIIPGKFFYLFSVWGINAFTLLLNIFILPVSYQVIKKGFYAARIFFTAFVVLVLSVFAFILNNFGILPSNIITGYGLQFGSAIEVIMLSLAIVQRIKQFRDDSIQKLKEINILKQKDNEILEIKVKERMATILEQKEIIEKNNLKITDSITYAKRIQSAILPGPEEMQKLLKQSFVFYLPKDIVSGDFYFVEPVRTNSGKELISFVVGDCTGHGVPGGFLTMLCSSFLKQSLTQYEVNSPGQALDFVNKSLKNHLKQTHPDIILRDGMDAAFCVLDKNEMKLYYAGANRSLIIVRNNQLTEIKPDKQSIGASDDIRPFTDHCIPIQHNDMIYLTSDGYADQFGGTDGKKFKNSALKKLFVEISELKINEQETILKQRFFDWKKNREQIDDVCVLGVRI
jgi:serine phosphatase RsbU (regulator of sigma subunit)